MLISLKEVVARCGEAGSIGKISLTLMLLVGNFGQNKIIQKTCKMTETLACGYSSENTQQELSNEYQLDRV